MLKFEIDMYSFGIVLFIVLVLPLVLGFYLGEKSIIDLCDQRGEFNRHNTKYTCVRDGIVEKK